MEKSVAQPQSLPKMTVNVHGWPEYTQVLEQARVANVDMPSGETYRASLPSGQLSVQDFFTAIIDPGVQRGSTTKQLILDYYTQNKYKAPADEVVELVAKLVSLPVDIESPTGKGEVLFTELSGPVTDDKKRASAAMQHAIAHGLLAATFNKGVHEDDPRTTGASQQFIESMYDILSSLNFIAQGDRRNPLCNSMYGWLNGIRAEYAFLAFVNSWGYEDWNVLLPNYVYHPRPQKKPEDLDPADPVGALDVKAGIDAVLNTADGVILLDIKGRSNLQGLRVMKDPPDVRQDQTQFVRYGDFRDGPRKIPANNLLSSRRQRIPALAAELQLRQSSRVIATKLFLPTEVNAYVLQRLQTRRVSNYLDKQNAIYDWGTFNLNIPPELPRLIASRANPNNDPALREAVEDEIYLAKRDWQIQLRNTLVGLLERDEGISPDKNGLS